MDIIESILQFPKQCQQAWEEALKVEVPRDWQIQNIVVCGMGGSALGAHVIQASGSVKVPFVINNNYLLPYFANEKTLVILVSYSGNTEEVLSCAQNAKEKGCKIIGITSGSKLGEWLKENVCPSYIFNPEFNTTKQPRMGVGYTMIGMMALLDNLKLFNANYTDDIVENAIALLQEKLEVTQKLAQDMAIKLKGKIPVIFASDYLVGNAHIFANQLNETAKTFSTYFSIPEANHHLLEGLKHPEFSSVAIFLGIHYTKRVIKCFEITQEILEKNGWEVLWYKPESDDSFAQSLQTLLFSSLVTEYLCVEYGEDPLDNPTVDYFKEKLG